MSDESARLAFKTHFYAWEKEKSGGGGGGGEQ